MQYELKLKRKIRFSKSFSVNINVENSSQTKKPQTDEELPPNFLLWTIVKCVGTSLGIALVSGVSFHLLWNRTRGKELKHGDHKSGRYLYRTVLVFLFYKYRISNARMSVLVVGNRITLLTICSANNDQ